MHRLVAARVSALWTNRTTLPLRPIATPLVRLMQQRARYCISRTIASELVNQLRLQDARLE